MAANVQVAVRRVSSVNPATGAVLREFECASESQVQAAVARARAAQVDWAEMGVRKRIAVVREFQRRLLEKNQKSPKPSRKKPASPWPKR